MGFTTGRFSHRSRDRVYPALLGGVFLKSLLADASPCVSRTFPSQEKFGTHSNASASRLFIQKDGFSKTTAPRCFHFRFLPLPRRVGKKPEKMGLPGPNHLLLIKNAPFSISRFCRGEGKLDLNDGRTFPWVLPREGSPIVLGIEFTPCSPRGVFFF